MKVRLHIENLFEGDVDISDETYDEIMQIQNEIEALAPVEHKLVYSFAHENYKKKLRERTLCTHPLSTLG